MKYNILQFLFILSFFSFQINCDEYHACCCFFKRDPFRGFQAPQFQIISSPSFEFKTEEDIANTLIKLCEDSKGIITEESLDRITKNDYNIDKKKCEKECFYLNRQLNDNYVIEQVKSREKKAAELKTHKRKLEQKIQKEIKINVNCLTQGRKCESSVAMASMGKCLTKKEQILKNNLATSSGNSGSFGVEEETPLETIGSDDSGDDLEETLKKLNGEDESTLGNTYKENNDYNVEGKSNYEIIDLIEDLNIKILYLQKKNAKPIDYILDRFNIKDNILAMLICLFESTLNDVMKKKREDLKEYVRYNLQKTTTK